MEAVGQLASGVAHDFNNLLAGIMGNAELLSIKLDNQPELQPYFEKIVRPCESACGLTQKLLNFSRKGQYKLAPVNIHQTIADAVGILSNTIDPRISFRQNLQADVSVVMGDPSQLESTLLNLGINAEDLIGLGVKGFIQKPFRMAELSAKVKEAMGVDAEVEKLGG